MHSIPVHLRACTAADASALALVGAATFLESFAGVLELPAILWHTSTSHAPAAYTRLFEEPATQAWMLEAEQGKAPVGYAVVTKPDLPTVAPGPADLELKRIYVFSRFHGDGAGQRLMDAAIKGARASGATRLLLGVYAENARALRFYARNGFVQIGVRQFHLGGEIYDDLVLGRKL